MLRYSLCPMALTALLMLLSACGYGGNNTVPPPASIITDTEEQTDTGGADGDKVGLDTDDRQEGGADNPSPVQSPAQKSQGNPEQGSGTSDSDPVYHRHDKNHPRYQSMALPEGSGSIFDYGKWKDSVPDGNQWDDKFRVGASLVKKEDGTYDLHVWAEKPRDAANKVNLSALPASGEAVYSGGTKGYAYYYSQAAYFNANMTVEVDFDGANSTFDGQLSEFHGNPDFEIWVGPDPVDVDIEDPLFFKRDGDGAIPSGLHGKFHADHHGGKLAGAFYGYK